MADFVRQHEWPQGSEDTFLGIYPGSGKDYVEFCTELDDQSSRGLAVLGAAFLDWRVTSALRTRLYRCELPNESPKHQPHDFPKKLFGSIEKPGQLAYLDKCKMAYCLGLVGEKGFRDLERIGQIRNRFAHQLNVRTFSGDEKVVKLCNALETPKVIDDYCRITSTAVPIRQLPEHPIEAEAKYRFDFSRTAHWIVRMLAHSADVRIEWPERKTGIVEIHGVKCAYHVFW
jgi:hypothetical protein